jgi:hypothetical protein
MSDAFIPNAGLLAKLGSIAIHAEEMLSPHGHNFDRHALQQLLNDEEVVAWLKELNAPRLQSKRGFFRNTSEVE